MDKYMSSCYHSFYNSQCVTKCGNQMLYCMKWLVKCVTAVNFVKEQYVIDHLDYEYNLTQPEKDLKTKYYLCMYSSPGHNLFQIEIDKYLYVFTCRVDVDKYHLLSIPVKLKQKIRWLLIFSILSAYFAVFGMSDERRVQVGWILGASILIKCLLELGGTDQPSKVHSFVTSYYKRQIASFAEFCACDLDGIPSKMSFTL